MPRQYAERHARQPESWDDSMRGMAAPFVLIHTSGINIFQFRCHVRRSQRLKPLLHVLQQFSSGHEILHCTGRSFASRSLPASMMCNCLERARTPLLQEGPGSHAMTLEKIFRGAELPKMKISFAKVEWEGKPATHCGPPGRGPFGPLSCRKALDARPVSFQTPT